MRITSLRIEIAGCSINDYRIMDRGLEFRALDPDGHPFHDQRGGWRRLTTNELVLHFRLDTVVAKWFLRKIMEMEEALAKAA